MCRMARITSETIAQLFNERAERYDDSAAHNWEAHMAAKLAAPTPGERVLDVACGTGLVSRACAKSMGAPADIVGVDIADGLLEVARHKAAPSMCFAHADATQLPFEAAEFDVVLCVAAVPYLSDVDTAVAEWRRVLRPRGRMLFTVPADQGIFVFEMLQRVAAAHGIVLNELNHGLGQPGAIQDLAARHALECVTVERAQYREVVTGDARAFAERFMAVGFAEPLQGAPQDVREAVLCEYEKQYKAARDAGQGGHEPLFVLLQLPD